MFLYSSLAIKFLSSFGRRVRLWGLLRRSYLWTFGWGRCFFSTCRLSHL